TLMRWCREYSNSSVLHFATVLYGRLQSQGCRGRASQESREESFMKRSRYCSILFSVLLLSRTSVFAAGEDDFYKLGPDSLEHEGVPHGKIDGPFTIPSQAYPGTQHTYWVYVPAQYDPAKPASLMIFNDGHTFMGKEGNVRATNVIDNLT